jgi:hypothetical protein
VTEVATSLYREINFYPHLKGRTNDERDRQR